MLTLFSGWREAAWQALSKPLDLLVIGGGITGAGVLHDAALRGLRAALVERGDFASGTSSRSSKLIHGGLRYLKRLQLGITRTASRERDLLLEHDPHLVWPVRCLYPSYADDPTPGWQVSLGLTMYDHLSPVRHRHERLEAAEVESVVPEVAREGLEFGLLYDDAAADDVRLVLAVIAASVLAGGTALSYTEAIDLKRNRGGQVTGAVIRDLVAEREIEVNAAVVVNATGVWVDAVRTMAGEAETRLRPSRGSHLLFPRDRLPLEVAVTGLSPDDGRPIFAVPHPEGTLIGTTDLFHDGPLDEPRPSGEEVAYLLRFATAAFPVAALRREDVCGAFAGVRPILDSDTDDPSEASREEAVWVERGLLSTAGGKLTTYRATAAEVVDTAVALLPEGRRAQAKSASLATAALPWRAAPAAVRKMLERTGATAGVAEGMVRRLGALAIPAAQAVTAKGLRPVADALDLCTAELQWHARQGGMVHLDDLLLRRTRLGMWAPVRCLELAPRLRTLIRRATGWSALRWNRELERLHVAVRNWLPPEDA